MDLATAFYLEDGFNTPVSELRDNLAVLIRTRAARVAIAGRQHAIVGFAITTLSFGLEQGAVAELEDLFVERDHRQAGVATALIDDSAEWARSRGCRTLEVVVAPNGNNVADLFGYYAHRRFIDEGRRLLARSLDQSPRPIGRRLMGSAMSTTLSGRRRSVAARFTRCGGVILRCGLIAPLLWIGAAKFTAAEANSIVPLVANQPMTGWIYEMLGVRMVSMMIGVIEIAAAVLIALKPLVPRVSAVGSGMAIGLFLFTVSFLFTTPGVVDGQTDAIPVLTDTGAFLIKDLALLGAAVWTLGDALAASDARRGWTRID
ncbi:DUF417 family protein [Mycobacterium sp. 1081908.1]|uniref:DUF417 family protein n=1 Tax=Mycobacterium sp. 1081908.1 TaxID=1834066 RepID=UPI0018D33E25|nr:DUF417 family protein [Mycobacterium sp. 1081908.1]